MKSPKNISWIYFLLHLICIPAELKEIGSRRGPFRVADPDPGVLVGSVLRKISDPGPYFEKDRIRLYFELTDSKSL